MGQVSRITYVSYTVTGTYLSRASGQALMSSPEGSVQKSMQSYGVAIFLRAELPVVEDSTHASFDAMALALVQADSCFSLVRHSPVRR